MRLILGCFAALILPTSLALARANLESSERTKFEPRIESPAVKPFLLAQNDRRLPFLSGLIESEARRELTDRGFKGKITSYVTSDKIKCPYEKGAVFPGEVCAAKPDFGERIAANAEISLLIQGEWTGKEPFGVPPKILGFPRAEAVALLAKQGWNTNTLTYRIVDDPKCKPNGACDLADAKFLHSPYVSEGLRVPMAKETKLRMIIGSAHRRKEGPHMIEMVNITGISVDEALNRLDKAGFRGDFVVDPPELTCSPEARDEPPDRVCQQLPEKGETIPIFAITLGAALPKAGATPASKFSGEKDQPDSATKNAASTSSSKPSGEKDLFDTLTNSPGKEKR